MTEQSIEEQLHEMTKDRNLWRDAHDEDCPNKAMLETVTAERDQLRAEVEKLLSVVICSNNAAKRRGKALAAKEKQ